MVTLENDYLRFSFPQIGKALHGLVEQHIRSLLPRMLAEDRQEVVAELKSLEGFDRASVDDQKAATEKVLTAAPEQIEAALWRHSRFSAQLDDGCRFATASIACQQTFRIPEDGQTYQAMRGVGPSELRRVDDFETSIPAVWWKRGGVLTPVHRSEALWLSFDASYPVALKVGVGTSNAVTGEPWTLGLQRDPQNYLVLPEEKQLEGFKTRNGILRQFLAVPQGKDQPAEEPPTGTHGEGIRLEAFSMKANVFFQKRLAGRLLTGMRMLHILDSLLSSQISKWGTEYKPPMTGQPDESMSIRAGSVRQEIRADDNDLSDWDTTTPSRCFIHRCDPLHWRQITGRNPRHRPRILAEYVHKRIPWFSDYHDELPAEEMGRRTGISDLLLAAMQTNDPRLRQAIGLNCRESHQTWPVRERTPPLNAPQRPYAPGTHCDQPASGCV